MSRMSKFTECTNLFWSFLKIGAFTFGGGYAMIPLIHKEAVDNHQWASEQDILDIIAIAESTPGAIAINAATFIGFKVAGFWGSVFATLGVVVPSFIIISIISLFFLEFKQNIWVARAFEGVRVAVILLMLGAIKKLSKYIEKTAFNIILLMSSFVLAVFFDINTLYILIGAAVCGILNLIFGKQNKRGDMQ